MSDWIQGPPPDSCERCWAFDGEIRPLHRAGPSWSARNLRKVTHYIPLPKPEPPPKPARWFTAKYHGAFCIVTEDPQGVRRWQTLELHKHCHYHADADGVRDAGLTDIAYRLDLAAELNVDN